MDLTHGIALKVVFIRRQLAATCRYYPFNPSDSLSASSFSISRTTTLLAPQKIEDLFLTLVHNLFPFFRFLSIFNLWSPKHSLFPCMLLRRRCLLEKSPVDSLIYGRVWVRDTPADLRLL